jgi:SOS-response transcriptional repressor LexA
VTPIQRSALEAVRDYWAEHGCSPSLREVARAAGLGSTSAAQYVIEGLEQLGLVVRSPGCWRSLRLTVPPLQMACVDEQCDPPPVLYTEQDVLAHIRWHAEQQWRIR